MNRKQSNESNQSSTNNSLVLDYKKENKRGVSRNCQICLLTFGTIKQREHLCKRCLRSICQKCGNSKDYIYNGGQKSKSQHRICSICKLDINFLQNLIQENEVQILKQSKIGHKWMDQLNLENNQEALIKDYQYYLKDYSQTAVNDISQYKQFLSSSKNIINEAKQQISISFCEFLQLINENVVDQNLIDQQIENVVAAFLLKNNQIGFSNELLLITLFLLCFCSEEYAFAILNRIYQAILPKDLHPKALKINAYKVQDYEQQIMKKLEEFDNFENMIENINLFLREYIPKCLSSLGLTLFTFKFVFQQIQSIFLKFEFQHMIENIVCIIYKLKDSFQNYDEIQIQQLLFREIDYNQIQIIKNVNIVDENQQQKENAQNEYQQILQDIYNEKFQQQQHLEKQQNEVSEIQIQSLMNSIYAPSKRTSSQQTNDSIESNDTSIVHSRSGEGTDSILQSQNFFKQQNDKDNNNNEKKQKNYLNNGQQPIIEESQQLFLSTNFDKVDQLDFSQKFEQLQIKKNQSSQELMMILQKDQRSSSINLEIDNMQQSISNNNINNQTNSNANQNLQQHKKKLGIISEKDIFEGEQNQDQPQTNQIKQNEDLLLEKEKKIKQLEEEIKLLKAVVKASNTEVNSNVQSSRSTMLDEPASEFGDGKRNAKTYNKEDEPNQCKMNCIIF